VYSLYCAVAIEGAVREMILSAVEQSVLDVICDLQMSAEAWKSITPSQLRELAITTINDDGGYDGLDEAQLQSPEAEAVFNSVVEMIDKENVPMLSLDAMIKKDKTINDVVEAVMTARGEQ